MTSLVHQRTGAELSEFDGLLQSTREAQAAARLVCPRGYSPGNHSWLCAGGRSTSCHRRADAPTHRARRAAHTHAGQGWRHHTRGDEGGVTEWKSCYLAHAPPSLGAICARGLHHALAGDEVENVWIPRALRRLQRHAHMPRHRVDARTPLAGALTEGPPHRRPRLRVDVRIRVWHARISQHDTTQPCAEASRQVQHAHSPGAKAVAYHQGRGAAA